MLSRSSFLQVLNLEIRLCLPHYDGTNYKFMILIHFLMHITAYLPMQTCNLVRISQISSLLFCYYPARPVNDFQLKHYFPMRLHEYASAQHPCNKLKL